MGVMLAFEVIVQLAPCLMSNSRLWKLPQDAAPGCCGFSLLVVYRQNESAHALASALFQPLSD